MHHSTFHNDRAAPSARIVATFSLSLLLSLIGAASSAFAADKAAKPDAAAPPALEISKKVFPPLKAANDALNSKQFDVALKKLEEAEAADKKTPYDQFRIEEIRVLVYLNQNTNFAEALTIYEKHQSNPEYLEPQQVEIRLKVMIQLAGRLQANDKVIEYGKQWLATHPDDSSVIDVMARASYLLKNFKDSLEYSKSAISLAEAAGKVPEELWFQLVISCEINLDNRAGLISGYEKLVRYHPKSEHWSKALETALSMEKNDAAIIYVLRLMADTDVLTKPDYYLEYQQRAVEKALPGEALRILETGFEKKHLGSDPKHQRALTEVRQKAQADKAQLPEIEKEYRNSKATTGQSGAGLGLAYFGLQMYEQAAQTLEANIAKGGLRNVEDYKMTLGISYLRLGQKEKAREQFQSLVGNAQFGRIAGFWVARTYN